MEIPILKYIRKRKSIIFSIFPYIFCNFLEKHPFVKNQVSQTEIPKKWI